MNREIHLMAATVCWLACASLGTGAEPGPRLNLVRIPAGEYHPIIRGKNEPERVPVPGFLLAEHAVTNGEYLDFVRTNANWRRAHASPLFVDEGYLALWKDELEPGGKAPLDAPVVQVSWFAARAYAKWAGARIPTTAEWESAARAGYSSGDGSKDLEMLRHVMDWIVSPSPEVLPAASSGRPDFHGIHNLHGLVWEWVEDFNSAMVTGESRADSGLDRDLFCGAGAIGAKQLGDYPAFMRLAFRSSLRANYCLPNLGFRCAKSIGGDPLLRE